MGSGNWNGKYIFTKKERTAQQSCCAVLSFYGGKSIVILWCDHTSYLQTKLEITIGVKKKKENTNLIKGNSEGVIKDNKGRK